MVALDSAPWVEKYRPDTLDDVAAHKEIISTSTYIYIYIYMCVCVFVYVFMEKIHVSLRNIVGIVWRVKYHLDILFLCDHD